MLSIFFKLLNSQTEHVDYAERNNATCLSLPQKSPALSGCNGFDCVCKDSPLWLHCPSFMCRY